MTMKEGAALYQRRHAAGRSTDDETRDDTAAGDDGAELYRRLHPGQARADRAQTIDAGQGRS